MKTASPANTLFLFGAVSLVTQTQAQRAYAGRTTIVIPATAQPQPPAAAPSAKKCPKQGANLDVVSYCQNALTTMAPPPGWAVTSVDYTKTYGDTALIYQWPAIASSAAPVTSTETQTFTTTAQPDPKTYCTNIPFPPPGASGSQIKKSSTVYYRAKDGALVCTRHVIRSADTSQPPYYDVAGTFGPKLPGSTTTVSITVHSGASGHRVRQGDDGKYTPLAPQVYDDAPCPGTDTLTAATTNDLSDISATDTICEKAGRRTANIFASEGRNWSIEFLGPRGRDVVYYLWEYKHA